MIAQTVGNLSTGAGTATANLDVGTAIGIDATGSTISVGGTGTITGRTVFGSGSATGLTITDSFDVIASVLGNGSSAIADADNIDAIGIKGGSLTAGPAGGSIEGSAVAGLNVQASTQNNPNAVSIATIGDSTNVATVAGISDTALIGGQAGTNTIAGRGVGTFNAVATSIGGDSTASSTANAFGITDNDATAGTMNLGGNVEAIARLTNTVTATTVQGNAIATATSNAVGLNNYNVTIIGGGSVTGRADALSRAVASDTTGSAGSTATI